MKYIKAKQLEQYINGRRYSSCSATGSLHGMRNLYGWDKAVDIIRSGRFYYAFWE